MKIESGLSERRGVRSDSEAAERYKLVTDVGKNMFENTALADAARPITQDDLRLIRQYHRKISPANPDSPWRRETVNKSLDKGEIVDPSTYDNWEAPGGPLEHIELATKAAEIIVRTVQNHLKSEDKVDDPRLKQIIRIIHKIDPLHTAAAAGFHDEGRELTHIFYTNEVIGKKLLERMGIRRDIREIMPEEQVLLLPPEQDMMERIRDLNPEEVLLWIADIQGKRKPGMNRLLRMSDINQKGAVEKWAAGYTSRPFSGRASDNFFRKHAALHNANSQRFLQALHDYISDVSDLTYEDLENILARELQPELQVLPGAEYDSAQDMEDGSIFTKEVQLDEVAISVKVFTEKGGKKPNEDGFAIISDEDCLQVIVVDGGTQPKQVGSFGLMTGGRYISQKVMELSAGLNPSAMVDANLRTLNGKIGEDVRANHHDVSYGSTSESTPYGSIAGVRIDSEADSLEVSNAGDVFVVAFDEQGQPLLLTIDDVRPYDEAAQRLARNLAEKYRVTVREVSENRGSDSRFKPMMDSMYKAMSAANSGVIPRITGSEVFKTHHRELSLGNIKEVLIFSDGAIPADIDITSVEGMKQLKAILDRGGMEELKKEIMDIFAGDPDFNKYPRFKDMDDLTVVQLGIKRKN